MDIKKEMEDKGLVCSYLVWSLSSVGSEKEQEPLSEPRQKEADWTMQGKSHIEWAYGCLYTRVA